MIYYDWMSEGWVDDKDKRFFVDMTPEGGSHDPELNQEFKTQQDFFKWYSDGFSSPEDFKIWFAEKNNWRK